MKKIFVLITILIFNSAITAQDSLYLVKTYTGTTVNKLTGANSLGDINGDGYDDYCVIYRDSNNLNYSEVYLGGTGFFYKPDTTLSGYLTGIGDINKDGFDDFIKKTYEYPQVTRLFLYYGSNNKYDNNSQLMVSSFYNEQLGSFIKNAGDINGDDYDDLMIGSWYNWDNGVGRVYIFYGGVTISEEPDITIMPRNLPDCFITGGDGIGDINDDGFDDFAIAYQKDTNFVSVYYGAENLIGKDTVFYSSYTQGITIIINVLDDINGDGKKEIGIVDSTRIKIFGGFELIETIDLVKYGTGWIEIFDAGDINNDNFEDFICGNTNYRNEDSLMVGGVWGYFGGEEIDTIPDFHFEGEHKWDEFGKDITGLGDINNDKYDEFAVLAPSFPDFNNPEGKLYVYSMQKITGVEIEEKEENKLNFSLKQNYPNPFNPSTTIKYQIPESPLSRGVSKGRGVLVTLKVYNLLGQEIATLVNTQQPAGNYEVNFDASNLPAGRHGLSSGVYIYRINAGEFSASKKLMLLK